MKEEGRAGARGGRAAPLEPPRTLGTLLVGNNAINAAAGSLSAAVAISQFGERWGVLIATVVTTVVILVVAEVTPKTLAACDPPPWPPRSPPLWSSSCGSSPP